MINYGKRFIIALTCLLISFSVSACNKTVTPTTEKEEEINESVEPIDYMTADYELVELNMPDEFKVSGDYSLQKGTFDENIAYFLTIDKTVSRMSATKDMYVYHIDTEEYEKVKSYDASKGSRILDFQIIDSDLYEIRFTEKEDGLIYEIVHNGEVLQQHTVLQYIFTSEFTNVNGKLQYMVASIQGEKTILYLYELDKGKIKELFSDDITLMDGDIKYNKWYVNTARQNSKSMISFVINDNITERLYVYDGKSVSELVVPFTEGRRIMEMVPLKDGIFFISFIPPYPREKIKYHYYDHSTKMISEVTGDTQSDRTFSGFTQISDDSFLFTSEEKRVKKHFVGTLVNNELSIRVLDKIPYERVYSGRVSDNQSLIYSDDFYRDNDKELRRKYKLFKIVWKEKNNQ